MTLPQMYTSRNYVFQCMSYTGELTVAMGADAASADTIFPENKRNAVIGDYLTGFSTRTAADGTAYLNIHFTPAGREVMKNATANAASSSTTMFFKVGNATPVQLTVSSQIDQSSMYISGGFTNESAAATSVLLNSALGDGLEEDLSLSYGDMVRLNATYGDNALLFVYIALRFCLLQWRCSSSFVTVCWDSRIFSPISCSYLQCFYAFGRFLFCMSAWGRRLLFCSHPLYSPFAKRLHTNMRERNLRRAER